MVRAQKVPCDGFIQVEDVSLELDFNGSTIYRSLVGIPIYPFPGKVGHFLHFQGTCIKDEQANNYSNEQAQETSGLSHANHGLFNEASNSRTWTRVEVQYELGLYVLESYSDSDWAGNKVITRSPCGSKKSDRSFAKNTFLKLPSKNLSYKMWSLAKLPTKYASKISTF